MLTFSKHCFKAWRLSCLRTFLLAVAFAFSILLSLPSPSDFCLNFTSPGRLSSPPFVKYHTHIPYLSTLFPFTLFYVIFSHWVFCQLPYSTFIYLSPLPSQSRMSSLCGLCFILCCAPSIKNCIGHIRPLTSICYTNKLGTEEIKACCQWLCTSFGHDLLGILCHPSMTHLYWPTMGAKV